MKLLSIAAALLVFGCLQVSNRAKTAAAEKHALAALYEGEIMHNLQNWDNTDEVTDERVKQTKKAIMLALRRVGFNTLPELDADKLLVSFNKEGGVISIQTQTDLCSGEDRSACFHLQIIPSGQEVYEIAIIGLPAYEDLSTVASSYSEDNVEELLNVLREIFPHALEGDQLNVASHGNDNNLTLVMLTDETPKRELHIEARDGTIDNSRNAIHSYHVYQDEMRK